MKTAIRILARAGIAAAVGAILAGCPLPYQFAAAGSSNQSAALDPTTPSITATPHVIYEENSTGKTGTVATGGSTTTNADTTVGIETGTVGAVIYYTTDGSIPDPRSESTLVYSADAPLPLRIADPTAMNAQKTLTVTAIAIGPNMKPSATMVASVTVHYPQAADVTFSPQPGTYSSDQSVALGTTTEGATIYYTSSDDGTEPPTPVPGQSSTLRYESPISVAGHGTSITFTAIAVADQMLDSAPAKAGYTINYDALDMPTFSVTSGTYTTDQSVVISHADPGAAIWYTTDGSEPAQGGNEYTGPITIAGPLTTTTVKALATMDGKLPSAVATVTVTVDWPASPTPKFTPDGGTYSEDQSVTLAADGADEIWYQVDGGEYMLYVGSPITVEGHGTTATIHAYTVTAEMDDSPVASAMYRIEYQVSYDDAELEDVQALDGSLSGDPIDNSDANRIPQGTVLFYESTYDDYYGKLVVLQNPAGSDNGMEIKYYVFDIQQQEDIVQVVDGTHRLDLDGDGEYDFWLQNVSSTVRYVTPQNGARFHVVGIDPAGQ